MAPGDRPRRASAARAAENISAQYKASGEDLQDITMSSSSKKTAPSKKASRSKKSTANKQEGEENKEEDPDSDFKEPDPITPIGTKRSAINLGGDVKRRKGMKKIFPPSVDINFINPSEGTNEILATLGLENPQDMTVDKHCRVASRFMHALDNHGLRNKPGAVPEYTPSFEKLVHVRELPCYDPTRRFYKLLVDEVALADFPNPDGTTWRAWILQAVNTRDPQAEPVDLFVFPVYRHSRCPRCVELYPRGPGYQTKVRVDGKLTYPWISIPCDQAQPACGRCSDAGEAKLCAEMRAQFETTRGSNIITGSFCPDKGKIIQLGLIKVDIMNKMPTEIDVSDWKTSRKFSGVRGSASVSYVRTFIDTTSLVEWKRQHFPEVDLGYLSMISEKKGRISVWNIEEGYGTPTTVTPHQQSILSWEAQHLRGIWCSSDGKEKPITIRNHPEDQWDESKLETNADGYAILDVRRTEIIKRGEKKPDYRYAIKQKPRNDKGDGTPKTYMASFNKDEQIRVKVIQTIALSLVGHVGSMPAIKRAINEKRKHLAKGSPPGKWRPLDGPYRHRHIWGPITRKEASRLVFMKPSTAVFDDLQWTTKSTPKMLQDALSLITLTDDRVCLAFVKQESLKALAQGRDTLNIFWAAVLAAQRLEMGLILRDDIFRGYCSCSDPNARAHTEHVCMSCHAIFPCNQMGMRDEQSTDSDSQSAGMLECHRCLGNSAPTRIVSERTLSQVVRLSVDAMFRTDNKSMETPAFDRDVLAEQLLDSHQSKEDSSIWIDGYSSKTVSLKDAEWSLDVTSTMLHGDAQGLHHPYQPSTEKPHSRWLDAYGKLALHHSDNVIITKDCYNRTKGNWPPSIAPILKNWILLKQKASLARPCRGYHPELQQECETLERVSRSY
jgi:hypothetical protein